LAIHAAKRSAGQPLASEQPASRSGRTTVLGVEDLRRLGHEVDAREADDVGLRLRRGLRELQRVADEVGDVLDLALLVVVREDDGVALALELRYRVFQVERGMRSGSSHE
jgi:hypothetical protein